MSMSNNRKALIEHAKQYSFEHQFFTSQEDADVFKLGIFEVTVYWTADCRQIWAAISKRGEKIVEEVHYSQAKKLNTVTQWFYQIRTIHVANYERKNVKPVTAPPPKYTVGELVSAAVKSIPPPPEFMSGLEVAPLDALKHLGGPKEYIEIIRHALEMSPYEKRRRAVKDFDITLSAVEDLTLRAQEIFVKHSSNLEIDWVTKYDDYRISVGELVENEPEDEFGL